MLVRNSRDRLVSFRLSGGEYESVFFACQAEGARSVSEFARESVLGRAQHDALRSQGIVRWLMQITEELSSMSRQTNEIVRWIQEGVLVPSNPADSPVLAAGAQHSADAEKTDVSVPAFGEIENQR